MMLTEVSQDSKSADVEVVFDQAFGLRIRNPKISRETLDAFCPGMNKVRLSDLNVRVGPSGEWVTMGVVVFKSEPKKSATGSEYIVWRLSDLKFGVPSVKVLLFGECVRHFWKVQVGATLLLSNAQWAEATDGKNEVLLKLFKSGQMVELGFCADFAYCQARQNGGEQCTNAVNTSLYSFCPFHIQKRARQLSMARGALNRSYNLPPKKMRSLDENLSNFFSSTPTQIGVKTVPKAQTSDGKIFTKPFSVVQQRLENRNLEMKEKRREELNKLVTEKPFGFGAKNLLLKQQKDKENESPRAEAAVPLQSPSQKSLQSMREFIRSQKRAAEILKNAPAKRQKPNDDKTQKENGRKSEDGGPIFGGAFTGEQIRALLDKKSSHDKEAKKAELEQQNFYFDRREIEEQIEANATSMMELKNCRVVSCSICTYTSRHQSVYCKTLGHEVKRHFANKRFFKCKKCQQRTFSYDRMPTKACNACGSKEFCRVAMKDERKVLTEREVLKIKEEEKNFSSLKA